MPSTGSIRGVFETKRSWRRSVMVLAVCPVVPLSVTIAAPSASASSGVVTAQNKGPIAVAENVARTLPSGTLEVGTSDTNPNPSSTCCNSALATPPAHGTGIVNSDGSFTYTPNTGFSGADKFTFTETDSDGNVSAPATVTLQVLANCNVNVWPVSGGTTAPAPQSPKGFYIGQSGGTFSLYTAHSGTQDVVFTGMITLGPNLGDVRLSGVTPHRNEDNPLDHDSVTIAGQATLYFHFDTYKSVDGVSFHPSCGSSMTFYLLINGNKASTSTIFLGDAKAHPATNPFKLAR